MKARKYISIYSCLSIENMSTLRLQNQLFFVSSENTVAYSVSKIHWQTKMELRFDYLLNLGNVYAMRWTRARNFSLDMF